MFSYYLTRVFFAFPKHKLQEIAKAFELKFNVKLTSYIRYRLRDLVSYIYFTIQTETAQSIKF
jgi:hypothetical protein